MTGFNAYWRKLRDKAYRRAFVAAQVKQAIPFQIRALMKAQGINQVQLAERAELTQGAVSRAADPEYGNLSLNTLIRIAAGFDVAFVGRFVAFSELGRWLDNLHDETTSVSTFIAEDERVTKVEERLQQVDQVSVARFRMAKSATVTKAPVDTEDSAANAAALRSDSALAATYN